MDESLNKSTCAVLLSTYNGDKYLRQQLDSIFDQKDVDITLFVRDDGSKDSTMQIIEEYRKNKAVIILDSAENVGPGKSFYLLLEKACSKDYSFDYFAFADQDDIWLEDKIESAIKNNNCDDEAYLYCSNQYIYSNEKNVGVRHEKLPDLSLIGHLYINKISGCTFVLNRKLALEILKGGIPTKTILKHRLHDAWIIFIALGIGNVFYDSTPHILYRIHESNTVGLDAKISFSRKIRNFLDGDGKGYISKQAEYALSNYDFKDSPEREYIEKIATYKKSFKSKRYLLGNDEIHNHVHVGKLKYKLRILLNYF